MIASVWGKYPASSDSSVARAMVMSAMSSQDGRLDRGLIQEIGDQYVESIRASKAPWGAMRGWVLTSSGCVSGAKPGQDRLGIGPRRSGRLPRSGTRSAIAPGQFRIGANRARSEGSSSIRSRSARAADQGSRSQAGGEEPEPAIREHQRAGPPSPARFPPTGDAGHRRVSGRQVEQPPGRVDRWAEPCSQERAR